MSVTPVASPIQSASIIKSPVITKKNDHDGDEVNGADPANEANKSSSTAGSANPNLGKVVNTTA